MGEHQIYNAITVIETVKAAGIKISDATLMGGIAAATVPARLELISASPVVFLDGAHNPNGADAISSFMKEYKGEIIAIAGMMADKNCQGFLKQVLPYCESFITVTVKENPRTISAEDLAKLSADYCKDVTVAEDYGKAIEIAKAKAQGKKPVFVFGSLYLAGAIREQLISAFNS